mmetsp:Transcript_8622/g.9485  ORF Transcript_8622/g.9485 Transcript_8622/m.9485 type:complete len:103 (+) Transcript_8622:96-404(+)
MVQRVQLAYGIFLGVCAGVALLFVLYLVWKKMRRNRSRTRAQEENQQVENDIKYAFDDDGLVDNEPLPPRGDLFISYKSKRKDKESLDEIELQERKNSSLKK